MSPGTRKGRKKLPRDVRFAVWQCHGKKCWMCGEPLRFLQTVIDHVIPRSFAQKPVELARALEDLGLPADFDVEGYQNLLPSCSPCNLDKAERVFEPYPKLKLVFQSLASKADWVRYTAEKTRSYVAADRILNAILGALEQRTMSMVELEEFLIDIVRVPEQVGVPDDVIILNDGYWRKQSSIVAKGLCRCERDACVGAEGKVYCYFHSDLSAWIVATGLYFRCYDEVVTCPRCEQKHSRGHIGRSEMCGRPFADQIGRTD